MAADDGLTLRPVTIAMAAIAERQKDFCISLYFLTRIDRISYLSIPSVGTYQLAVCAERHKGSNGRSAMFIPTEIWVGMD